MAAGADGLTVETHPDPNRALSDDPQALHLDAFADMVRAVRAVHAIVGT